MFEMEAGYLFVMGAAQLLEMEDCMFLKGAG